MDSEECFICGVSGQRTRLFDAISPKGIEKICDYCSIKESIPVLKRPTTEQLKESEKDHRPYREAFEKNKKPASIKNNIATETTLREIVDRNYMDKSPREVRPRPDLVEHFHWVIMRARRSRKMTPEQLAKEISESVAAVKMAEQGILPDDDYRLIKKLESFLGIRLAKDNVPRPEGQTTRRVEFDPISLKTLTIDDLKRMKEGREEGKRGKKEDIFEEVRKKMDPEEPEDEDMRL
ncbi:MAG: hypothetical protein Q8P81_04730 [Nanoarchaeota archaeon]|nr:hypothetical protein [Nanoarchaeota archaeon]